jgi:pimeloyl-ACP methyl ester carboxylesterase
VKRSVGSWTLAVIVALAACGSPAPSVSPSGSAPAVATTSSGSSTPAIGSVSPSPTPSPSGGAGLRWTQAGTIEVTSLKVPLDYANPAAGTITLAIARQPATDPARRIGTLFLNPGGPGARGIPLIGSAFLPMTLPPEVRARFDIVSWDPRGVGQSGGVTCPASTVVKAVEGLDPNPKPGEYAAFHTVFGDLAADCESSNSASILPYLAEANSARDMDAIRAALGEDAITYVGWSYGTYLGYLYATLFPSHLRAAVLDGPVDPNLDLAARDASQAQGFEAAFRHLLALCAADTACPFHGGGDPLSAYDRLIARLRTTPLTSSTGTLTAGLAVTGTIALLYGQDAAGLLESLHLAEMGNGDPLIASADAYYANVSLGSYEATVCLDAAHPDTEAAIAADVAQVRQDAPRFGPLVVLGDLYGCLDWPAPAAQVAVGPPPAGLPPIVVIASRWDPASPPWQAAPLATALGTGVVLTREGIGHTSGLSMESNACIRNAVASYLLAVVPPAPSTVCKDPPVPIGS